MRVYLVAFAVAVAIPIVVFATFLLVRYAQQERVELENAAERTARQVAQVVDAELSGLLNAITGLAASSNLANGNIAGFYEETVRFVGDRDEVVSLRDYDGAQLLNTQRPFGTVLPAAPGLSDDERESYRAGKPRVGNVFVSRFSGQPRVAVMMPVKSAGRDLLLAISVPTTLIRDVIAATPTPGWLIGVGDRAGQYVTRSERHEEVSGTPAVSQYLAQATGQAGAFTSRGLDGSSVLAGYFWSDFSGWLFAANTPLSNVQAPLLDTLFWVSLLGVVSIGLSVLLALWLGRRFTSQTRALVDRAMALSRRRPPEPFSGSLREFEVIADAFASADEALRRRSQELEAVLSTVPAAVWFTYDSAVGRVSRNRYAAELMRMPVGDRVALDTTPGLPRRMRMRKGQRDLRPEELPLQRAFAGERVVDDEHIFVHGDGTSSVVLISAQAIEDGAGRIVGAAAVGIDISERKRAEEQRRLLVNELNHRVKNTLAIVQSIVLQTLRTPGGPAAMREALQSRLVALSGAHDVLNRESWEGAQLSAVVSAALGSHAGAGQVQVDGPDVWLPPSFAMSLTLVINELATNATKYGALKVPQGRVDLGWTAQELGADRLRLILRWSERNGPAVGQPERQGFGSRLIGRLMSAEEEGSSVVDYAVRGVICTLRAVIPTRASVDRGTTPDGET